MKLNGDAEKVENGRKLKHSLGKLHAEIAILK